MEFPHLRSRLSTPAAADCNAAPDHAFDYGLEALLNGIQAQLGAQEAS